MKEFDKVLVGGSDERTMKCAPSFFNDSETSINLDVTLSSSQSQQRRDNHKVREDSKLLTLDSFMEPSESKKILAKRQSVKRKAELNLTLGGATKRQKLELDSMRELQQERTLHTDQDLGWSQKISINLL